ncbi:hypothetical protein J4210_05760 [Candidatus Woesearchaeota archaeon]|nr:hypothetical protein [Candidatus Woesearchaeota archaeon]
MAPEQNILLAGLIAGSGAIIGDFIFFKLMRGSFSEELHRLAREKTVAALGKPFRRFKNPLLIALAGLVISSPLPTEIGVALFSSLKEMTTKRFLVIAYILHTAGIFVILLIGKVL